MGRILTAGALVFLAALVLLAPLRVALGWMDLDGLSARRAEGTIWSGRLTAASWRGLGLGDPQVGLDPLRGGVRVRADGEVRGTAVLRPGGLADADAVLPLARIAPGLPLRGELALADADVRMDAGRCGSARGRVEVRGARFGPAAVTLAGPLACREGRLVAPLAGEAAGVVVEVTLSLDGAGRYEAVTRLRATDPAVLAGAGAAGFERGLDGFARTDRGVLR